MLTALPALPFLLLDAVYLLMLVGLGLIVFVPFAPGLAVMGAAIALYVGYASYTAQAFAGVDVVPLVGMAVFVAVGLTSSWWSHRLGLHFTYVTPEVMWGAMLGSIVFAMVLKGMFWMLIGLIVGAIAMEMRSGRRFQLAVHQGVAALYSMLGPRGFQLIMALLTADLAVSYLRVAFR